MGVTRKRQKIVAVAVFNGLVEGEVVAKQLSPTRLSLHAIFTKLPAGKHGFHIHKAGDLRGDGCKGACAHYHIGPSANHGGEPGSKRERHTGDLGNIEMSSDSFSKTYILNNVTVRDLWGRSIIVHADEDDLGLGDYDDSKITGHSGSRIACAIFGRGSV
jgi:Cu-Zn family superoxide dismutase